MGERQPSSSDRAVRHAVQRACRPVGLLPPGQPVVVAVSGGPDSMALLHALTQSAPRFGIRLHVAHLHHGLRGAAADADAAYVQGMAAAWGLGCTLGAADVAATYAREGGSLEAVARRARYQFLAQVAQEVGAARVVVAHTADDQAETVLLRIIRGTGVSGLAGMGPDAPLPYAPPELGLRVVRPLLTVTRAQVEAYCRAHGITPRYDTSNLDPRFLRNRVRHELMPLLRTLNPNAVAALTRLARHAAADDAVLAGLVDAAWSQLARSEGNAIVLAVPLLRAQPEGLRARVVRHALGLVRGEGEDTDGAEIDQVLGLLEGGGTRVLDLPGGVTAVRRYDDLLLAASGAPQTTGLCAGPPLGAPTTLTVPGQVDVPGWRLSADLVAVPEDIPQEPLTAYLDADRTGAVLTVRAWRPGDRIQPLGMTGRKKLGDFFTDAKVPAPCRDRVPVVEGPAGIAWVVGHAIGHPYRVTSATARVVLLTARRHDGPAGRSARK